MACSPWDILLDIPTQTPSPHQGPNIEGVLCIGLSNKSFKLQLNECSYPKYYATLLAVLLATGLVSVPVLLRYKRYIISVNGSYMSVVVFSYYAKSRYA